MIYFLKYSFLLLFLFLFYSCSFSSACTDSFGFPISSSKIISNISNMDKKIEEIAREIYPVLGGGNVIITDFVDASTYQPTPSGVYLADLLRGFITTHTTARVLQLDIGRSFTLDALGLSILTREAEDVLKQKHVTLVGIIGSYSIQGNRVHIFVRRINLRTGRIISTSTKLIPYACIGESIITPNS
jgi:hypothetical protein